MVFDDDIEILHSEGLLPDRYYYQMNGRSEEENYRDQIKRLREDKKVVSNSWIKYFENILFMYLQKSIDEMIKRLENTHQ